MKLRPAFVPNEIQDSRMFYLSPLMLCGGEMAVKFHIHGGAATHFALSSQMISPHAIGRRGRVRVERPEVTFPAVLFSQRSLSSSISLTTSHFCSGETCGEEDRVQQ